MASYDWRLEMENMLAAFNRQAIHSLSLIRLAFKRTGLSFTPEFKIHFMQVSTNRINEAYDQFQMNSMFEDQLNFNLHPARNGTNGVECEADDRENVTSIKDESDWITNAAGFVIQIDNLMPDDEEVVLDNAPVATNDLYGINESIAHQSNTNGSYSITPEVSSDLAVEMDDSNDSVEMVEISTNERDDERTRSLTTMVESPNNSTENELIPTNEVFNNETAMAELTTGKSKKTRSNNKNPHKMMKAEKTNEDRNIVATKGAKSSPTQMATKNRCTVCGIVCSKGHLSRHMRTHTGEKPHQCNHCWKRFKRAQTLITHAATHIGEYPFHCRACFQGFSSKAEMEAHEKQCRKRHYECHLCKQFVNTDKAELIKHMRTHTGDKPARCEICKKKFFQKQNLKRHLNTVHARINF